MLEKDNYVSEKRAAGDAREIDDMVDDAADLFGSAGKSSDGRRESDRERADA